MKISLISSLMIFSLFAGIRAADFDELNDKIIKANFDINTFCSKDGPIRRLDGQFCEKSDGVAAFILLTCQDKIIKSHCHFKAGQRIKKAHNISWLAAYEVYKKTISTSIFNELLNHASLVSDAKKLLSAANQSLAHGDRKMHNFCRFLREAFKSAKKEFPLEFQQQDVCSLWN